jgi:UrcA family protein
MGRKATSKTNPMNLTNPTIQETTMNTITPATRRSRTTSAVLFSALALSLAAMCQAGDSTSAFQQKVKYADLDVSRPAGAVVLYGRISSAAGDVCRILDRGDLGSKTLYQSCVRQAISDAVASVDQPALTSVYNVKNPTTKPVMLAAGLAR